jgi:hypothetical protein
MTDPRTDLIDELKTYLRGGMTLPDLRDRLAEVTWDNPAAPQIAHDLERVIDDALDGHATPQELDAELRLFARQRIATG